MPRRRKLPPDYDPKAIRCAPHRGPKHVCPHCLGTTRPVKGQTLEQAIAVHDETCPAIHRINPKRKKE